jgi:archaellum component FlaC
MRKLLVMFFLLALVACGKNDTVTTPDHKGQIDSNTARIELLELSDEAQDLRLDALEQADLDLAADIANVSNNLNILSNQFSSFRNATNFRFFMLNLRLSYAIYQIDNRLDNLEEDVEDLEDDVARLRRKVRRLKRQLNQAKSNIATLQSEVLRLDSEIVDVIYPCGNDEVLLETRDGLVGYFQNYKTETIEITDSITVDSYTIPAHFEQYCVDTNFFNGECNQYETRLVGEHTIPTKTYNVGDTASIQLIKDAYLSKLPDGNYRTTATPSCNFSIVNGEVQ